MDRDKDNNLYREIKFYSAILSTVISGYSIYSAIHQQQKINKLRSRILMTESRPVYSPTSVMVELKSRNPERNFTAQKDKEGKVTGYKGHVFLMGNVAASDGQKGIKTRNNSYFGKNPEFALKIDYKQDIFSNDSGDASRGKYKLDLNRILQSCKMDFIPQFLVSDSKNSVQISNYDRINYEKALEITYIKEEKRALQVHQFIFTLGLLGLKFITELFFKDVNSTGFRGISIGIRDTEVGIKIGSGIAVIGELIYDMETKKMRIDMPEMIVSDRLSFLNSLKSQLEQLLYNRNIFIIIGAITGVYSLRRVFKYLQKLNKLPKKFDSWKV